MDASTAADRLADFVVIDVREPEEWDAGHIAGAQHIPLGQLTAHAAELEEQGDAGATFLFVCSMGGRSDRAAQFAARLGLAAENLDGGLLAWEVAGLELVRDDGSPGRVVPH